MNLQFHIQENGLAGIRSKWKSLKQPKSETVYHKLYLLKESLKKIIQIKGIQSQLDDLRFKKGVWVKAKYLKSKQILKE